MENILFNLRMKAWNNAITLIPLFNGPVIGFKNNILSIADDGEGIQSQNIYNIFDKYFQSNDETDGLGIGLNIVKEFCDKHKIDIKINSSKNGTIFNLNLAKIIEAE